MCWLGKIPDYSLQKRYKGWNPISIVLDLGGQCIISFQRQYFAMGRFQVAKSVLEHCACLSQTRYSFLWQPLTTGLDTFLDLFGIYINCKKRGMTNLYNHTLSLDEADEAWSDLYWMHGKLIAQGWKHWILKLCKNILREIRFRGESKL